MVRKTPVRMSQMQTVQMSRLLEQQLILLPKVNPYDPQLVEYAEGWDDERIAKAISPDLGVNHVQNLRQNLFGRLFVKNGDSDERVTALEAQVVTLTTALRDLITKHDKLCSALSLNRVIDARHLSVQAVPPIKPM